MSQPPAPRGDEPPEGAGRPASSSRSPVRLRRAPRFTVFIGTGIAVALVAAAVVTLVYGRPGGRDGVDYGLASVFGYLAVLLGLVGALAGGVLALLVGRRAERLAARDRRRPPPR